MLRDEVYEFHCLPSVVRVAKSRKRYRMQHTGKGHAHNRPQGPKRVPGRLRPRIFLKFGTTRVVGRQPHAPAAFTPRVIPWYSFLEAESTTGHMIPSLATEKIPSLIPPGIDPETVRLIAQCLNHYDTHIKENKTLMITLGKPRCG
jgi:hypothetical protein